MIYDGISKSEIEEYVGKRGDFINIDYLSGLLKKELPFDVKKFVHLKMIEIYEHLKMFADAARVYESLAIISLAFSEKVKYYVKETESYIKAGAFDKADKALNKAIGEANSIEKDEIYYSIKDFYLRLAENYENQMKINHASRVYEKLIKMRMTDYEKKHLKEKLIRLYEKLGKFKEAKRLEGVGE
ncbi:MAG: hypothetical protein KKF67_04015 [Nanoarchaeota archaeon]|nr:hypothetical protein [Nanoarchaeota archaeon]